MKPHDELAAENERLRGHVEQLRRANGLLHDATIVLRNGMGGHQHWDHTMQYGAGCEVCKQQQAARDEATKLIEAAGVDGPSLMERLTTPARPSVELGESYPLPNEEPIQ